MTEIHDDELEDIIESEEMKLIGNELLTKRELQNSRSRLRNWLNRDATNSEKRARDLALQLLHTAENGHHKKYLDNKKMSDAMIHSVSNLAGRVLSSMKINSRIVVSRTNASYSGRAVSAYTDFDSIHINVDPESFNVDSIESISELVHVVKGLVYHEGGHIAWTFPQTSLCEKTGCSGNHVIDGTTYNSMYSMQAWNVLEDQRMEWCMIATSPVLSKYFTTIVAKYVIDPMNPGLAWPWLAGRTYLPERLRTAIRAEAMALEGADLIPKMESVILRYINATEVGVMHDAMIEMTLYLRDWLNLNKGRVNDLDRHSYLIANKERSKDDVKMPPQAMPSDGPEEGDDKVNGAPNSRDNSSKKEDSDVDPNNDSGDSSKKEDATVKAGTEAADKSISEQLTEMIEQGITATSTDEVNEVMADINTSRSMIAVRDSSIRKMNSAEISGSQEIRNSMLDVLDRLIVQVDPSWMFYRENGVIDPTAYMTRDPGDMNFWSGMDGDKGNGHDLAVSLLIDSSGSMGNAIEAASMIAMGIRKACEHYDIPCTVTSFCDEVRLVAAGDEACDFVKIESGGGTMVFDAMTILDDQRYGKTRHLVVILTDGEWADLKDVRIWGVPTRHIMIVGYNIDHAIIANKGANSAITINNISDLAPLVTNALAGYFAG